MVGATGADPEKVTLRQLVWMFEGAQKFAWDRTALLAAIIVNVNRSSRSRSVEIKDFHPCYEQPRAAVVISKRLGTFHLLKQAFGAKTRQEREACP